MRTLAQIEAARKNGAKSKGPATHEGRERSSQNSRKHGLSANKSILIDGESEDDWQKFHDAFILKFQPRDFVEERLVLEMAVNQWRLERLWALQAATVNQELPTQLRKAEERYKKYDAVLVQACAHNSRQADLQILAQHETRLSRNFDRALKKFNDIRDKYPPVDILENEPEPASDGTITPADAGAPALPTSQVSGPRLETIPAPAKNISSLFPSSERQIRAGSGFAADSVKAGG